MAVMPCHVLRHIVIFIFFTVPYCQTLYICGSYYSHSKFKT